MSDPLVVRLSGAEIGELRPGGRLAWREDWHRLAPLNARVLSHSLPFGRNLLRGDPAWTRMLPPALTL